MFSHAVPTKKERTFVPHLIPQKDSTAITLKDLRLPAPRHFQWIRKSNERKHGFSFKETKERFVFERRLGEGSYAKVYLAKSPTRSCVAKYFKGHYLSLLLKEIQITAYVLANLSSAPDPITLKGPHVDFCCSLKTHATTAKKCKGDHLMLLPYVSGALDIYRYFSDCTRCFKMFDNISSLPMLAYLMTKSLRDFVHALGVVHRDVKLNNFLIFLEENEEKKRCFRVMPIDFGLSQLLTDPGEFYPGSSKHFAPESCPPSKKSFFSLKTKPQPPGPSTQQDAFSLGITFLLLFFKAISSWREIYSCSYAFVLNLLEKAGIEKSNAHFRRNLLMHVEKEFKGCHELQAYLKIACDLVAYDPRERCSVSDALKGLRKIIDGKVKSDTLTVKPSPSSPDLNVVRKRAA